ncbi:MAG: hypothetical protein HYT61_01710 [Candidatus Yanofskybacteria bacterium]|nr:hypothetical protein [Candidatus Yanofskybacteria bacterium]
MVEQLKLYKNPKKEEQVEHKKLRWEKYPTFWRAAVFDTRKEHVCARCEKTIPNNSRANVTVDLEGGKPDFTKTQYWHPGEKCPKI